MAAAYEDAWGNPSSVHLEGRKARALLDEARGVVAQLVGGKAGDVVFTSGGTEASNIALRAPFAHDVGPRGAILLAPIEHASILAVAEHLEKNGVELRQAKVTRGGTIDVDDVRAQLARGGVRLVAVQAVNGETGVIQPIVEVAEAAHAHGAVVHVDAIQAVGRVAPPPGGFLAHADSVVLAAHKIRGPKGIGALCTRPGHPVVPVLRGGAQERGLRPGTQDAALASGFAIAVRAAGISLAHYQAVARLRDRLQAALVATNGVGINGDVAEGARAPHVVHASFRGWPSPELVAALDLEGLAVSGGPACHAGVPEPSSTMTAMWGAHPDEHWRFEGPVRFSLPPSTTSDEVDHAIAIVRRVIERERT